jgi:hypothetical protein
MAQSMSTMQRVVHEPLAHRKGSQSTPLELVTQLPLPLQIWPLATVPVHTLAPHDTPGAVFATPAHMVTLTPSHAGAEHGLAPLGQRGREPCG